MVIPCVPPSPGSSSVAFPLSMQIAPRNSLSSRLGCAQRAERRDEPRSLGEVLYVAGSALTWLGWGDVVPMGGPGRAVLLTVAGKGVGVVALVITFRLSLYGAFQRREIQVVSLDSR